METKKINKEIKRRQYHNRLSPFPVYDTEVINDLKKLMMITKKEDYNNVKVTYCKTCLSLHIKTVELDKDVSGENKEVDYCVPCGNTDLGTANIKEWEDLYEERYGERFLTKKEE